jgi:hypothetical protein
MAFVAFNVAADDADELIVRTVLGTHNLLLGSFKIQKVSHWAVPPGRGG